MNDNTSFKVKDSSFDDGDEFERLCKIVHYQKTLFVLLIVQTIVNFSVEFAVNDFILISLGVIFLVVTVIYVTKIIQLSRMLNKTPLTVLLGFLGVIYN